MDPDEWTKWWDEYRIETTGSSSRTLPLLARIKQKLPDVGVVSALQHDYDQQKLIECTEILQDKLTNPCLIELIWSYWQEEGMLVQTMNSIVRRFQNIRGPLIAIRWRTSRSTRCGRSTTCCGATRRTSSTG